MMKKIILQAVPNDQGLMFRNALNGQALAFAGDAFTTAHIAAVHGWNCWGSPTCPTGVFIATRPSFGDPRLLPISHGSQPWVKMAVADLMDFVDEPMVA